jgi:hypothetical protein
MEYLQEETREVVASRPVGAGLAIIAAEFQPRASQESAGQGEKVPFRKS